MRGNYVPWIALFLILGFGFSIVQSITFGVFSFLALPFGLSFFTSAAVIGVGIFLWWRGYPWQTWVLAGAVFVALLTLLALVRGFTITEPDFPDGLDAEVLETYYEEEPFLDIGYFNFDNTATLEEDPAIIEPPYDFGASLALVFVELGEIDALGGQWGLVDANINISGDRNINPRPAADVNVFVDADDPGFVASSNSRRFVVRPEVAFGISHRTGDSSRPQTLVTNISADIVYMSVGGELVSETLTRQVEIVVPPINIMTYETAFAEYKRSQNVVDGFGGIALGVVMLASVGVGGYMVREGALAKPVGGGGFGVQMVVRKQTGLQKLGLEAHTLNTLSDDVKQGMTEGVFVGVVNAQSPAGRGDLRSGDIIISFNGKPVNSPNALQRAAAGMNRGDVAEVVLMRHNQQQTTTIKF